MLGGEVARLLRDQIGLSAETVGDTTLQQALKQRMDVRQLSDPEAYWRLLSGSQDEAQELINAVIVPETWFFRDPQAFVAMTRHARAKARPDRPTRILSLPCASGEEAYSIAMAMFDAGFPPEDFSVDGFDVSSRKIPEAQRAVYGRNSFRGRDLEFRKRHFNAVEGGFQPRTAVLRQVRFKVGNLFDPALAPAGAYDIVFCRNLLIYFDRETQLRALDHLGRLLADQGLLLVGPAESSLPGLHGFVSTRTPMAFSFTKRDQLAARPPTQVGPPERPGLAAQRVTPGRRLNSRRAGAPDRQQRPAAPAQASAFAPPPAELQMQSFAAIEQAANAGRLEETRAKAQDHIDRFGPSADVFFLVGLAYDAQDSAQPAIEHYRRALYLAPDHQEALAHLALLLERQGDAAAAKVFKERLARLEARNSAR